MIHLADIKVSADMEPSQESVKKTFRDQLPL